MSSYRSTIFWAGCAIAVALVGRSVVLELTHHEPIGPAITAANVPGAGVGSVGAKPANEVKQNSPPAASASASDEAASGKIESAGVTTVTAPTTQPEAVAAVAAVTNVTATPAIGADQSQAPDELFRRASPSVYVVEVTNDQSTWKVQGSGFLVSSDGLLVTNFHVIRNGTVATILTSTGESIAVQGVVAVDPDGDLALLQTGLKGKPFLTLGKDTTPVIGTRVYAIGSPRSLANTLSDGLISGVRTTGNELSMLQTTAAISHGSSGGPLLTADGKVIGVTSAMNESGENLNFAIPVSRVKQLIKKRGPIVPMTIATSVQSAMGDSQLFASLMGAVLQHRYNEAADLLAAEQNKNTPNFWILSGWFQQTLGNPSLAAQDYQKAISLGQKDSRTQFLLGQALFATGKYDESINALRQAVILDQDNIPAWEMAALCFQMQYQDEKAIELVHKAMKIKADDAVYYLILGTSYGRLKLFSNAIAEFNKYVKVKPNDPAGWCGLGDSAFYMKDYDGAEGDFDKALAARADYAYAYLQLGQVHYHKADVNAAMQDWNNAVRFDPQGKVGAMARVCIRHVSLGMND